jgi:hypothetical protein
MSHASNPYSISPQQELHEVFWRTLIGDVTNSSRPAPSIYGEIFTHHVNKLMEVNHLAQMHDTDFSGLTQSLISHGAFDGMETFEETFHMKKMLMHIGLICWHPSFPRKICITEKGIGLVPKLSGVGDDIAVIFGSQVPFVLRSKPGGTNEKLEMKYQLVGECYVHGIMDGQALASGCEVEDFEII